MKYLLSITIICAICTFDMLSVNFSAANAEDTMPEIVVTANRSGKEITQVPANISVITEADIKKSNATTVSDILRTESGLVVKDTNGAGKTTTVDIRGFGEVSDKNVLVLVDGRRITQVDLSGTDWAQIPLSSVERIEIIRGSGSVLYGDNASAGIVNIITKQGSMQSKGEIKSLGGSYNMNTFLGNLNGGANGFFFSASQRSFSTDGYRQNNYFISQDGNIRFGMNLTDKSSVDLSIGSHNDKYGLPGYMTETEIKTLGRKHSNTPDDWAQTQDTYNKLQIKNPIGKGILISDFTVRNKRSQFEWISWAWGDKQKIDSMYFTPRYVLEQDQFGVPAKFTAGFDVLNDRGYSQVNDFLSKKRELGAYFLDEVTLAKVINLSLGYRHDSVKYIFIAPTNAVNKRDTNGVWQGGASYSYRPKSSVYANYSQSFRNPVIDEYFDPWAGLNTKLHPQNGFQIESGVRHRISDKMETGISAFRINIEDEIFYNKLTPPSGMNENYDGVTRRQGIESSLIYKTNDILKATLNYSYTDSEFVNGAYSGSEIPGVPHNKASLILTNSIIRNTEITIQSNYLGKQYLLSDFNNIAPKMDTILTTDAKAAYKFGGLNAFFGVNNIFDRKYSEYGVMDSTGTLKVFYPAPERNYTAGVSIEF